MSAERTRLDEIRHLVREGCHCRKCVAIRELLAVVEAAMVVDTWTWIPTTPKEKAELYRQLARIGPDDWHSKKQSEYAAAWEALT